MAEWTAISGGGFDYVQTSAPSGAEAGETWLDTSVNPPEQKVYNGSSWTLTDLAHDIKSGRTRELLMLLQDDPVPEIVDPLNFQLPLSAGYKQNGNDYNINSIIIDDFSNGFGSPVNNNWGNYNKTETNGSINLTTESGVITNQTGKINATYPEGKITANRNSKDNRSVELKIKASFTGAPNRCGFVIEFSGQGGSASILFNADGNIYLGTNDDGDLLTSYSSTDIQEIEFQFKSSEYSIIINGTEYGPYEWVGAYSSINYRFMNNGTLPDTATIYLDDVKTANPLSGYVTDKFTAPTTAPADFSQWESIQAKGVSTGGSTSTSPVEFEILNSSNTVLNSTPIPKSEMVDTPFKMRERVYSKSADSDGQSDFIISETESGGSWGIPILSVISVKKNGSVIDNSNWSFDGNNTVTIDTSNVTITTGDKVEIKYDFDVFDETIKPRAYLKRESESEESPSISHFKYEYVI
jgi:hypothetical protein